MEWKNNLTSMLGISYPIVQAPMLGITTPEMVAAVSNAGGLGSLPIGNIDPSTARTQIQKVRELTTKPFAVNVFAYDIPIAPDQSAFDAMQTLLQGVYTRNGLGIAPVDLKTLTFFSYKDLFPVLIEEKVDIVSFTFGIPDSEGISLLKQSNAKLIGTATSLEEAVLLEQRGMDAIVAQGIEAGGHRGTFIAGSLPQIGVMALVPQLADRIKVPVIAAGGIMDGRGVAAGLMLGAAGVQPGSAFLLCNESLATDAHKAAIAAATDTTTRLTRAFSGRWARGLTNTLIAAVEDSNTTILPYPYQDALTQPARKASREQDNPSFVAMWAGQAAGLAKEKTGAADIIQQMIAQAEQLLPSLKGTANTVVAGSQDSHS
ncbi:nitronate monooxygenase family protein [Chitinophaga sp. Cy-1792]|uniref:NAD(P)H-dependent flavin oxidoreductase n=1 Tax=Chitinophaga sp. Cy-1792 TaxID=2608339 RepID=UPI00141EAE46|nr:nitronate monooxygenase family protein [Chitinophaga sp. Cy-1792]NIG56157.1 nitronate monooxygenase [Chitinophaga sp. Cy-1792]